MAPNSTGVLKRHRPQEKFHTKKYKRVVSNPPTEELDSFEWEAMGYREPTMYDKLLSSLGSSIKVVADMNKTRQREEEGKSDTEEDADEKEENPGSDDQRFKDGEDDEIQGAGQEKNNYHSKKEDSDEDCETDEDEHFSEHFSHKLSNEEVETLPKANWRFKWEAPAFDKPNCKWKGTSENFLDGVETDAPYGINPKLYNHWLQLYKKSGGKDFESSQRRKFFSISIWIFCTLIRNPFYNGGAGEDSSAMDAYLMHCLNHIFKSRDLVKKNERKIKIANLSAEEVNSDDRFRDRGYTSPKVLILLPLRSIAFRVVNRLIQLTPEAQRDKVKQHARFKAEYGCEDESNDDDGKPSKPCDWQTLFGEGNKDDNFMLGIEHTGTSIRLYGDIIYSSDIIIASPLKLKAAIDEAEENEERDVDYLSSIEVLVIDHADIISMQNVSFLATVVKELNELSKKYHGTDITRIRCLYQVGHARFYRQSIFLTSYLTPEINPLFNHHCLNYKGKMKLECEYEGVLKKVLLPVSQIYERFDIDYMIQDDDARFEYFTKKIFPRIKNSVQGGVMIFSQSQLDFVRLRKFLHSENASFGGIEENTSPGDKSDARRKFFNGSVKIMLYTERAHFYWRYKIRGVKNLILYQLPERKEFYPDIMNMIEESHDMISTVLFSRYDLFRLERILGSAKAKTMISSETSIFTFHYGVE